MEKSLRTCTQHAFWKTCIIPQDIHKSTIKLEFMVIQQRNVVIENPFVMHMQEVYNISLNYKMLPLNICITKAKVPGPHFNDGLLLISQPC